MPPYIMKVIDEFLDFLSLDKFRHPLMLHENNKIKLKTDAKITGIGVRTSLSRCELSIFFYRIF